MVCHLLEFEFLKVVCISSYTLALSVKSVAFSRHFRIKRLDGEVPDGRIFYLLHEDFRGNLLFLVVILEMVMLLLNPVVHLNVDAVVRNESNSYHGLVKVRDWQRLLVYFQLFVDVEDINLLALFIEETQEEEAFVLVRYAINFTLGVLLNQVHPQVLAMVRVHPDNSESLKRVTLSLILLVVDDDNDYAEFGIVGDNDRNDVVTGVYLLPLCQIREKFAILPKLLNFSVELSLFS